MTAPRHGGPPGIGMTALGIARLRALESARPDRLFDDPYADLFVATVGDQLMSGMDRSTGFAATMPTYIAVRTRFFDDWFAGQHGLRQVVLLAAGLDARAYRLPWPPGTTVFELDLPDLLAFKESVLADQDATPAARRVPLAVDLRDDWPAVLRDNGFDPAAPTAWLAEGLLMYLSAEDNDRLLERITASSAPGSALALGHVSTERIAARRAIAGEVGAAGVSKTTTWGSGLADRPEDWLARYGWQASAHAPEDLAPRMGRAIPEHGRYGESWLVTATR